MDKELSSEYIRLKELAEFYYKNLTFIGERIGKTDRSFAGYKYKPFGKGILLELKEVFNINPDYIKHGIEPKFINNQIPEFKGDKNLETLGIDYYLVTAYAGNGITAVN